jgi:solute carrier family 25 protein 16
MCCRTWSLLQGILPYAGLKFFTYQHLKNSYKAWQAAQQGSPANPASPGGQQQPAAVRMPLHLALVFGGISGLVGQTLTYPLDVIRRTMQVEGMRQLQDSFAAPLDRAHASGPARPLQRRQRPSMLQTAQQIGVRGMFRGLSLNYLKVVPSTAVGWTVYELSKAYLGCHSVL